MLESIHRWLAGLGVKQGYIANFDRALARIDIVEVGVEAALIVGFGIIAVWMRRRLSRLIARVLGHTMPLAWKEPATHAFTSVAAPLFWLIALWAASLAAQGLGYEFQLASAAVALLAAWVTIRLLSFAVRNPFLSATISLVAWSIAALSILGLLHPLTLALDRIAFTLGHLRISLLMILRAMLVLGLLLWFTTLIAAYLERQINQTHSLTPSLQALLVRLLNIILPAIAILIGLEAVGVDLTALTVLSGAIGIGIGLGLQKTVSNLIAGLTLIMGKSIKPGDVVAYKNTYGWVTSMGARFVAIATRDGSEYLVPNEEFISNGVENWSYSNNLRRLHIPFGVAYESDMHEVIAVALEATRAVERILKTPAPVCLMTGFGDSSVDFEIRCWINDPKNGIANAKSAVFLALWDAFKARAITLPFPQRDIHVIPAAATSPPVPVAAAAS